MFGSVILDVVIGLVFIFLLYSLLATIINEIIATFLGLRARNLQTAIWRMLGDDSSTGERKSGNWLGNFFKRSKFSDFFYGIFLTKKGYLFEKFYNQPTIKYLTNSTFFSKPSYINPSDFSKSILDILKSEGEGENDLEKIKNALDHPAEINDLISALKKLLNDSTISDDTQKIKAIKQVFNRMNQDLNLLKGDTRKHILSLLNDAQNDLVKFKKYLENWFDNTMDRTVGWYKRKTQVILLFIGFAIAALFNINTIEIVKKLSKDKDARDQVVQMATSYIENNPNIVQNFDSLSKADSLYIQKIDTLLAVQKELEKDINDATELLAISKPPDSIQVKKAETTDLNSERVKIYKENQAYVVVSSSDKINHEDGRSYRIREENDKEITYAYFSWWKYIWLNKWGYLITALAISLGASFWFDLLNKIVKLRNSLQQKTPEQNGGTNTQVLEVPALKREG